MEHAYGLEIPQALDEACDPRRLALVVYDMQVGILRQIENGADIIAKVGNVLESARRAGVRIFFMRRSNDEATTLSS